MKLRWWRRFRRRRPGPQECRVCGVCCEFYSNKLRAGREDITRWQDAGRLDLILMVGTDGRIWVDPSTGEHLEDCPFLKRTDAETARCRIHALKPTICRGYPTRAHGYRCLRGVRFPEG